MMSPAFYENSKQNAHEISSLHNEVQASQILNSMFTDNMLENFDSSLQLGKLSSCISSNSFEGSLFSDTYDAKDEVIIEAIRSKENSILDKEFSANHSVINIDDSKDNIDDFREPSQIMKEIMNFEKDSEKRFPEILPNLLIEKEEIKHRWLCNACFLDPQDKNRCIAF
ncbi:unnamed protein product [Blepharisma stoltei]|uniref:Uncharacterized protein n=1 Tax=Blepharisma stoltei TaxID=1481888 RepID=A0AAU9K409_9CILI|nr:unnamed protein product [Blepharisma stoltei]